MTYVPLPNVACIAGLILGASLIVGADFARAEMRACTAEEAATFEGDEDQPVLCDVMTVTGKRVDAPDSEFAKLSYRELFAAADLPDNVDADIVSTAWQTPITW